MSSTYNVIILIVTTVCTTTHWQFNHVMLHMIETIQNSPRGGGVRRVLPYPAHPPSSFYYQPTGL